MRTKDLLTKTVLAGLWVLLLTVLSEVAYTAQYTIPGVPDYQNNWFTGPNDCAPTAGSCVLGFWDSHGYDNLITGSADYSLNPDGVTELVDFLKIDMEWTSSGTFISNIPIGIEATANNRRGYAFSADNDDSVSWNDMRTEIDSDRPFVFSILYPYYGSYHSVTGVGYTEDAGGGGGTYYLNSIADSYVDSSNPNQNNGSISSFFVGKFGEDSVFESFVKFDLTSIPDGINIERATLRLYCNMLSGNDELIVWLPDADWSESAITWNNRPRLDLNAGYSMFDPLGSGQIWEIDVTDLVDQWIDGSKLNYGFLLSGYFLPNDNWALFTAREGEYEPWRPELVIDAGEWSDEIVIVHDNWTLYFPYDPDVWLNFNECSEAYLTKVLPGGGTDGDPYEPDDTHDQANEILSGSPQNHSIVPATDEDWVWFSLSEESEVIIETSGPSGDTQMWLYDDSLNEIEYDDDSGTNYFSRIDRVCGVDPLAVGTYYVKIDEYENDDEIPSYDIILTATTCTGAPGQLQFSSASYIMREDKLTASIIVSRVGGNYGRVTVDYATNDGTTIVDYDYLPSTGTIIFADGDTKQSFSVEIIDDNTVEEDEIINLSLSNPTGGATLGNQTTAFLMIIDNEPDLNNDAIVNFFDYSAFARHWLDTCTEPNLCDGTDFNASTKVDVNDLRILCDHWLDLRYELIFYDRLDSNPNWTTEGQWAFGQPTGGGGIYNGNPDPTSGFTGSNVYGVNLDGDYTLDVNGPYYLTAGPFDCNGYFNVLLKFARWLNTDAPGYVSSKI